MRSAIQDTLALTTLGLRANDDYCPDRLEYAIEQAAFARDHGVDVPLSVYEEPLDHPDVIIQRLLDTGFKETSFGEFEKATTSPEEES